MCSMFSYILKPQVLNCLFLCTNHKRIHQHVYRFLFNILLKQQNGNSVSTFRYRERQSQCCSGCCGRERKLYNQIIGLPTKFSLSPHLHNSRNTSAQKSIYTQPIDTQHKENNGCKITPNSLCLWCCQALNLHSKGQQQPPSLPFLHHLVTITSLFHRHSCGWRPQLHCTGRQPTREATLNTQLVQLV